MEALENHRDKFRVLRFLKFKRQYQGVLPWFLSWKWLEINGHDVVDYVGKCLLQEDEFLRGQESLQTKGKLKSKGSKTI